MKSRIIKIAFSLLLVGILFAQKQDYSKYAGYVDFSQFEKFNMKDGSTEVVVEEKLLRMVGKMVQQEDKELQKLLNNLKLIKAVSFDVDDKNFKEMNSKIQNISDKLDSQGWDRIVKSKSDDRLAYVYVKTRGEDDVLGLVVLAIKNGEQAAFVNVVGDINMEAIGRLSTKFNIPALGVVGHNHKKDKKDK